MKSIPLTKGYVALVDDEDFERLSLFSWSILTSPTGNLYARRVLPGQITRLMQDDVMPKRRGFMVDHRNLNSLDNQRSNLRYATKSQNQQNKLKQSKPCHSRFKGVSWHKRSGCWTAQIGISKRLKHLGNFSVEETAAKAYDKAAIKYFGEFARLNFSSQ